MLQKGEGTIVGTKRGARAANIGSWLEGVRTGEGPGDIQGSAVNAMQWEQQDVTRSATTPLTKNLAQSGVTLLTEMGIDHNTTQFITTQAMHAKARTMGPLRAHSLP